MPVFGIIGGTQNVRGSGALTPSPMAQRPKEALSMGTLSPKKRYSKFERSSPSQVEVACAGCGRPLFVFPSLLRDHPNQCCDLKCMGAWRSTRTGPNATNWHGGLSWSDGRANLYMPNHPRANSKGYVRRAWIVAEQMLGRALLPGEEVHHKDEDKANDDPSNLVVTADSATHMRQYHGAAGRWSKSHDRCLDCGTTERKHHGRGLCLPCLKRRRRRGDAGAGGPNR